MIAREEELRKEIDKIIAELKLNKEWTMDNKIKSFISSLENQYLERKSARVEPLDNIETFSCFCKCRWGFIGNWGRR